MNPVPAVSPIFIRYLAWVLIGVTAISGFTTMLLTREDRKLLRLDIPNARSSHAQPVPRGGGLSIVLSFSLALLWVMQLEVTASNWAMAVIVPSLLVALIGFLDDLRPISARIRLVVHLAASVIFIIFRLSGEVDLPFQGPWVPLFFAGAVLLLTWFLNLYNFMDGLAAGQCASVCVGFASLLLIQDRLYFAAVSQFLVVAALGFLFFNWHPARIFMGDVGSGYLGFAIGSLILELSWNNRLPLASGLILMGAFVVDSTVTLIRRWMRDEDVTQAHRDHAYQHAAQLGLGHKKVVLSFLSINFIWLLPMAYLSMELPDWRWLILGIAYAPLVAAAIRLKAGMPLRNA